MEMIFVKPADGGRVRQPERQSRVMPEAGAWVPRNAHYERLLAAGDVIAAEAPKATDPAIEATQSTTATASSGRSRKASAASEE